jgi:CheY-like chemotaxis protein
MDISLPDISGVEALQVLAENPATAHIPVIAISANALPRDIEKGLAAGFFRYLTKPIRVNEFLETLDVALQFARTGAGKPAVDGTTALGQP